MLNNAKDQHNEVHVHGNTRDKVRESFRGIHPLKAIDACTSLHGNPLNVF